MDIDVINALQRINVLCNEKSKKAFSRDISRFINYISKRNSDERYELFCKEYGFEIENVDSENIPECYIEILKFPEFVDTKNEALIIEFFQILGKSYLFSRSDRKDVDKDCIIEYIGKMSRAVSASSNYLPPCNSNVRAESVNSNVAIKKQSEKTEEQNDSVVIEPEESVEDLLEQLHSLIGLDSVKNEVDQIVNLIRVRKKAEEFGENQVPLSLHLVFYGNPGTGKTTVARLLAKIYKGLGVLSTGQLIEVDRGGLVGGYVGQTAIKTQEVLNQAMGGVLFIDEAYALTHGKGESDFGQEAVDTILKTMEDKRDQFVVIVAGYPDLMKEFISSNPGLKSRFNQYIFFEDYTPEQLYSIFKLQCAKHNLVLEEGGAEYVLSYFKDLYDKRSEDYANGREVRNYFETVYKVHANRLGPIIDTVTREEYITLSLQDLEMAAERKVPSKL